MDEPWPRGRSRHGGIDEVPLPSPVPGRLWLAGRRYVGPDPEGALESVGASVMVCLCESFEIESRYPGYVEWLDRGGAGTPGAGAPGTGAPGTGAPGTAAAGIWWPVPDLHAPPVESARSLVAEIAHHLDRGDGVLVHCGAGMGRAGTVAAALLLHYGESLDEARQAVAAARPGAGPEVGAQKDLLTALAR